ncbi:MAG: hypothetical protein GY711_03645 [bacterium]|nr:hypothetical protein [bacterium]
MMEPLTLVVFFLVIALVLRLIAGAVDGHRVEEYARERGWEFVDKSWAPFGPGWFGEKGSRIYLITYRDQQGHVHRAHVKTSMLSGVYLTGDEIVEHAPMPADGEVDLAAENKTLRDRVAELEAESE